MGQQEEENVSWSRGKCIGRGCFGSVSLAVNKSDGAVFAVKSVDRSACLPQQMESLENEIRILRSLSSPFVVEYLGDDDSPLFRNLHVEYMPGGTVADVAADEGLVRFYTWCLVSALRHVHSMGIVHCDVKGRNVLVGPDRRAKLADFGSALHVSGENIRPRGSPLWMAPEVVRGESQGPESDVWSLGCTVIEMITGKPAWEDSGAHTLTRLAYSDDLPAYPARLSQLGRDFLDKCFRRDPTRRWSCDQLLHHPFLLTAPPLDSSPRCVLDWVNSEFETLDSDEPNSEIIFERIGKLAGDAGANWVDFESSGWMTVRTGTSTSEEIRTNLELQNSTRAEEGTSGEYSAQGVNWEFRKTGGAVDGWCGAGPSCCRYGPSCELRVEMSSYRSYHFSLEFEFVLLFYCCYRYYFLSKFSRRCIAFPYGVYSILFKLILYFLLFSHVTNHILHLNLMICNSTWTTNNFDNYRLVGSNSFL